MEQNNKAPEKPSTEHLALEVLKDEQDKSKAKDMGIIGLTIAIIVVTLGLSIINYRNDQEWRKLFSKYDFISQDGTGINSINDGTQGDLNNGAESKEEKGQE